MNNKKIKPILIALSLLLSFTSFGQLDLERIDRDSTDIALENMWIGTWVREKAEYLFGDVDTNYRSYQFFPQNRFKFNYYEAGIYFSSIGQYFVKDSLLYIVTVWRDTSFISDVVKIDQIDSLQTVDTRIVGDFANRKTTYARRILPDDNTPLPVNSKSYERQQNAGFAERRPAIFS
jgi:hypothetical protein